MEIPLAHSAPDNERKPHAYANHVRGAVHGARTNAEAVARHMSDSNRADRFVTVVVDGTTFHDLGKLDMDNQKALRQGRSGRLKWDHIDAGVAHLMAHRAGTAAWIVRAHHSPGLPCFSDNFGRQSSARKLRGGRHGMEEVERVEELTVRTDKNLAELLALHVGSAGDRTVTPGKTEHGLFLRLALSCLVDGDHGDAAGYEHGWHSPQEPSPRWEERLARLDAYVASLPESGRQADRDAFYRACRNGPVDNSIVACEGPVGIGKTTAVTAWALRRAIETGSRRLFIVAPYTTILSQTASRLRDALVLPGEGKDEVIAEHHHRADFSALESRDLATLWRAPIVVTTGVQFFETLAACDPARLRKLHSLPGSVVILDEAHAALPAHLWRQNWAWIRELTADWGCSFVFASGSLARVWEHEDLVGPKCVSHIPDLADRTLTARLAQAEHGRVHYSTLGRREDIGMLIANATGPCLAVFNTVQTAAVTAMRMRESGKDVLHLSTALCPDDRLKILAEVQRRLAPGSGYADNWSLVATSLVEAGVDLSFRTAFRERFSTSSMIQIGGRVNRHGSMERAEVYDFQIAGDELTTAHPGAAASSQPLARLFDRKTFDSPIDAAKVVTDALLDEVRNCYGNLGVLLTEAEKAKDYPEVAHLARLIDADTHLVVVKPDLKRKLNGREKVTGRELLRGSVQIWNNRIAHFGLETFRSRSGVYCWQYDYDPEFLGYMAGALRFATGQAFIV